MSNAEILMRAWEQADTHAGPAAVFDVLCHADYVRHSGDESKGREEFESAMAELYEAFPDLKTRILETLEDGDRVAYRWESTGTHNGTYLGVLPTRKRIVARGITISRFADGQVIEDWTSWDKASVLQSLGIVQLR